MAENRMLRYCLFLFFTVGCVYAQESPKIKGVVLDSKGAAVSWATVSVLDFQGNILAYTTTNNNGVFAFKDKPDYTKYKLRVQHLNYNSEIIEITTDTKLLDLEIYLIEKENILEEVVLSQRLKDLTVANDTIRFNLAKLLNDTEHNLKDILQKLPGIFIDGNGKIFHNGKPINHILIEGDEMFGQQHRVATENLKAEIIAGIEVLLDYKPFSSIEGFEQAQQTALNIKVKESFKERLNTDAEVAYGLKNRFNAKAHIYNFKSADKISVVGNANNIDQAAISVTDYIDLRNSIDKQSETSQNTGFITHENLPSFLFSDEKVKQKHTNSLVLNKNSKQSDARRWKVYSVFNTLSQIEEEESYQQFFGNTDADGHKTALINGFSLFNANTFKFENKKSEDSYNSYLFYTFLSTERQDTELYNQTLNLNNEVDEFYNKFHIKVGHSYNLKKKMEQTKLFLNIDLANNFTFDENNIEVLATTPLYDILFEDSMPFRQLGKYQKADFLSNVQLSKKLVFGTLSVRINSFFEGEHFSNKGEDSHPLYNYSIDALNLKNSFGTDFSSNLISNFRILLGVDFSHTYQEFTNDIKGDFWAVLPRTQVTYRLGNHTQMNLGYRRIVEHLGVSHFVIGRRIENYRSVFVNSGIHLDQIVSDSYSFGTNYMNSQKGWYASLNLTYNVKDKSVGTDVSNTTFFSIRKFQYVETNNLFRGFMYVEKKHQKIPYSLRIQALFQDTELGAFVDGNQTILNTSDLEFDGVLSSVYSSSTFNFRLGFRYKQSMSSIDFLPQNVLLETITPYAEFTGNLYQDKFNWIVYVKDIYYNSLNIENEKITDIGFTVRYSFENMGLFVNSGNLLNISSTYRRNQVRADVFMTEESLFYSLPGYINFGVSYSF